MLVKGAPGIVPHRARYELFANMGHLQLLYYMLMHFDVMYLVLNRSFEHETHHGTVDFHLGIGIYYLIKCNLICTWLSCDPFYWHGLTLIPAWIGNCMHYTIWDDITYPFHNFNGAVSCMYTCFELETMKRCSVITIGDKIHLIHISWIMS